MCVWQLECSICRVCPKIFMEHIWPIFDKKKKKYTYPWKKCNCHLKWMKGKLSKISSLTHCDFSIRKIHKNEKRFLMEICYGECSHLFSIWKSLGIPWAIFQLNHPSLLQYKIPIDITFFSPVLKHDKLKGPFQLRSLGFFS